MRVQAPFFVLIAALAVSGIVPEALAGAEVEWKWRELAPTAGALPEARRNGTAIYDPVERRLVVFGGTAASGLLDDVWAFDLRTRAWKRLETSGARPEPRLGHNAVYDPIGHQMVVWAGQQGSRFFNDIWLLDLTTLRWSNPSPAVKPRARYGSAAVFDPVRRALVQFAGFTEEGTRFQDTQAFLLDSAVWQDLTPAGSNPRVRCLHTAAFQPAQRRLILHGGQNSGPLDDLWAFDLASRAWTELTPAVRPAGRYFASSFVDRAGRFVLFGGTSGSTTYDETWTYDFDARSWSLLDAASPPPNRYGAMGARVEDEDRFVVFGGQGARLYNDVWELASAADPEPSGSVHFGQFANGASWVSSFVLTNPSTSATAAGSVSFFDDRGEPLRLAIGGQAPAASVSFQIAPLGSATFSTDGAGELVSGWARVSSSSPVAGVIKFTAPDLGTAGVGGSTPLAAFVAPVSRSAARSISTGIAIAAAGAAVDLTLTLRSTAGVALPGGTLTRALPANGHLALFVEQLFPDADTRELEGTLTVTAAGGTVIATALQLGSRLGEFTTLPVAALR